MILAFGDLTSRSFPDSSLQPLAQLVAAHENVGVGVYLDMIFRQYLSLFRGHLLSKLNAMTMK